MANIFDRILAEQAAAEDKPAQSKPSGTSLWQRLGATATEPFRVLGRALSPAAWTETLEGVASQAAGRPLQFKFLPRPETWRGTIGPAVPELPISDDDSAAWKVGAGLLNSVPATLNAVRTPDVMALPLAAGGAKLGGAVGRLAAAQSTTGELPYITPKLGRSYFPQRRAVAEPVGPPQTVRVSSGVREAVPQQQIMEVIEQAESPAVAEMQLESLARAYRRFPSMVNQPAATGTGGRNLAGLWNRGRLKQIERANYAPGRLAAVREYLADPIEYLGPGWQEEMLSGNQVFPWGPETASARRGYLDRMRPYTEELFNNP